LRWPERIDVVVRRRISNGACVVAAIRNRQHPGCYRNGSTTAAASGGARSIESVERRSEDRIVGLRPQAEFCRIGLSDHDATGLLHPLHEHGISDRYLLAMKRRALRGAQVLGSSQILDRLRKPVHPALACISADEVVFFSRFGQDVIAIPK